MTDIVSHCPRCLGTGRLVLKGTEDIPCPYCSGTYIQGVDWSLTWSRPDRSFRLDLRCHPDLLPVGILPSLPGFIAETSRCECGSALQVESHSVEKSQSEVKFTGHFVCRSCRGDSRNTLQRLRHGIGRLWTDLMKLKVGVGGIEIEKASRTRGGT